MRTMHEMEQSTVKLTAVRFHARRFRGAFLAAGRCAPRKATVMLGVSVTGLPATAGGAVQECVQHA